MSDERPVFVTHPLYLPHLRRQGEAVAQSFNPGWRERDIQPRASEISSLGQQIVKAQENNRAS